MTQQVTTQRELSEHLELIVKIVDGISQELTDKMEKWLDDNPVDVDWRYDSELSSEDIDALLRGEPNEVHDRWWETCQEYIWELEEYTMKECLEYFADEILNGYSKDKLVLALEYDQEDLNDIITDWEFIQQVHDTISIYPTVHMNLDRIAHQTRPRLTFDLGPEHIHMGFGQRYEYDDLADMLELFNINPIRMQWALAQQCGDWSWTLDETWPSFPERDNNEIVTIGDAVEDMAEMFYSGVYLALCTGDLFEISETVRNAKDSGDTDNLYVTIPTNTHVLIHSYWHGSSSCGDTWTKAPITVKLDGALQLMRDGAHGYGVDAVFGTLDWGAWDSRVKVEVRK